MVTLIHGTRPSHSTHLLISLALLISTITAFVLPQGPNLLDNQNQDEPTLTPSDAQIQLPHTPHSQARLLTVCIDPCDTCSSMDGTRCNSCVNTTYWYDWMGHSCNLCSSSLDHCLTCYDQMMGGLKCTQCIDNTVYLSRGSCLSCSVSLQNCATCSDSSTCLSCLDDYNYLEVDDKCHPCSDHMDFCLICLAEPLVVNFNCNECISDAYFLNDSGVCVACSEVIPLCVNCTNNTYCFSCVNNSFAFNQTLNACVPCAQMFQNCSICTYTECIVCQEAYALYYGKCECPIGWKVNDLCTTIIGCTQPANYPDATQGCTACNQTNTSYNNFQPIPTDALCICQLGQLIGEYCIDEIGCIATQLNEEGLAVCVFCNTIDHFLETPNAQGHCQCVPQTERQGQTCTDICGDGFLLPMSLTCDDGNLIDGDGCSSQCQVQTSYRCQNGSTTHASQCVYIGSPITLTLKSIKHTDDQNQGVFVFVVEPGISNFGRMDLIQNVIMECNSTYTIPSVSFDNGLLTIKADYTENMEGRLCSLAVSFDKQYIISPNYTLHFQAVSENYPLVIIQDMESIKKIKFSLQLLSYVVLGLFLLSLPHKMIGPELLISCQMVYLSNTFYTRPGLFSLTISNFQLITGGWSLFSNPQDSDLVPPFSSRVSISPFFLQSTFFIVMALLISMIGWFLLMVCNSYRKEEQREGRSGKQSRVCREGKSQSGRQPTRLQKLIKFVYYILVYPIVAGFLISLFLAGFVSHLRLDRPSQPKFPLILSSCSQVLVWLGIGVVLFLEFTDVGKKSPLRLKLSGLENVKNWYIPVFLIKTLLVILLFEVGIALKSFQLVIYPLLALMTLYWIGILGGKPYSRSICNITILIAEASSIYSAALPLLLNRITLDQSAEIILIYCSLLLVCLVILLSVLRVVLLYYTICRNALFKEKAELCESELPDLHEELNLKKKEKQPIVEQKGEQKNPYSIFTQEANRRERNSVEQLQFRMGRRTSFVGSFENAINSIFVPQQEEPEENLELKAIKRRLREDLLAKKEEKKGRTGLQLE